MMFSATLCFFAIFVILQVLYLIIPMIRFLSSKPTPLSTQGQEGITILIPAFNEERIILTCLYGILQLDYSKYQVIIINDGSTDHTLELLQKNLHY